MNQFQISLLVLACLTSAYASGCVANKDTIEIFPSLKERMQWSLHDGIFSGEDLTFELIIDEIFKVQNPLEQTGGIKEHAEISDPIRAAKPLHTKKMQSWLNSFVFLSQGVTEVSLYFAQGNSLDKLPTPDFSKKTKIADVVDNLQCYDVEFIDSDKYIVDCQKEINDKGKQKQIDVFYIYSVSQNKVTAFEEESFDKIYSKRVIGLFYQTSITGKETTYILRVTPSYSLQQDGSLTGNSIISAYILNDNYTITAVNYILDNFTMALLLGKTEMEFNIVDVEISYNGFIFLLDAQYGLFIVQFKSTGSWVLFAQADLKMGKIYAFDIDFEHKKDGSELGIVAILGYDFFAVLNAEKSYIQKLPFIQLDYPATIKLTENHVVVRNNEFAYIYTLDVEGEKISLLTKLAVTSNDVLLVNPYEPDIIEINAKNSSRYTISTGFLKYDGHTVVQTVSTFTLKATAPNKQECQVYVTYQIIENNENWIYQLPTEPSPFPKIITEVPTQQFLKRLASGPNLQYSLNVESNVKVDIETRIELDVNGWPQDVIYAEVISQDSHTRFYQALQTKDFKLQIWICEHKSLFSDDTVCEMYLNDINIGYKATKDNFSIWLKNGIVYFLQLDNLYSLSIKTIKSSIVFLEKQIQLDNSDTDNQIVSILNCGDYLLIKKADKTILSYLTYRPETFALTTINGETFSQYGYQKEWEPVSWFTNKKLHPNLVFIVHTTHILILDTDYGYFGFIKNIDITQGREYSVAIGQKTFFLVQSKSAHDATDARIFEYNFESINNVYLQKELHLFWYDISLPLQVDFSEDNGFMFVRGVCLYCAKSFIIVFQPNVVLHDVLVQAWPISDVVVPETTPIILSVDGAYQTYLYLNSEGQQWLTSLFDQPTIAIEAKIDSLAYSEDQDLELKVRNYNFAGKPEKFNTIQIKQTIRAISTQTTIVFDQKKFGPDDGVFFLDTDITKTIELGTEWYQGQIGEFKIQCDQCGTNIHLTSTVSLQKSGIFKDYEIRDQVKYNDKYNILQATRGLLFLNTDGTLASVYDFDLPDENYKCYQATVSKDSMVVYSLCHDGEQYTVYATGCFSITGCSPLGEKFKLGTASKIQVVDNEVLVVLHTDALKLDQGEVVIYGIVMTLDAWRLEIIDVINLNTLNSRLTTKFNDFKPADFQVVRQHQIDQTTYSFKLFISDSLSGFIFIDFTLTNLAKYQFQNIETINLHNLLNNDLNQYTLPTTKFLSFDFIFEPIYDWSSKILRTHILVLSSDTSHYGIRVFFKEQNQYTVIERTGLCTIINRYGWDTINKIAIHQNQYLAVPYTQNKEIIVAIYDFEVEIFDDKQNLTPAVMIGSYRLQISEEQWVHPLNMAMFFDNRNYKNIYVSQFSGPLSSYKINKSPILIIDNSDKQLEDQYITISANNDFTECNLRFYFIILGTDAKQCVPKLENVYVNPSNGEVVLWNLSQNFFEGLGLKYSVDQQQTDFSIIQPTTQIGDLAVHTQAAHEIVSAKALQTPNQLWTNQFAFLNKETNKYQIYYTKTASLNTAPSFTELYTVKKTDDNLICYDFAELSTTIFTIDCQINNNKFLILIIDNEETYTTNIQNTQTQRRLGSYQVNENHFVIRVTLSITTDGDLDNNSFVELFQLTNNQLVQKETLDKTKLSTIYGKAIDQLNIVDFKIGANGAIYLLDAKIGIFVVSYDTDWKFNELITIFSVSQSFAFDVDFQADQEQIVVLAYNYYAVYDRLQQTFKIQDLTTYYTTYPQQISTSQGFVYLYNSKKLSIYHTASKESGLVDLIDLQNGAFISNPLSSEIVTITLNYSNRWYISLGSLKFTGTAQALDTPKTLEIKAISAHYVTCSGTLQYSVLASNSQALIKKTKTDQPFPEVVDEFNVIVSLGLVSAPNIQYELPNALQLKIFHNERIEVQGLPSNIIYSSGQVVSRLFSFYQVFQTQDKMLRIQECYYDGLNPILVNCLQGGNIQVQQTQNDQVFHIWVSEQGKIISFYALNTEYSVYLYEYDTTNREITIVNQITFPSEQGNQVISVLKSNKFTTILLKNGQLIMVDGVGTLITKENLIGFEGNWNPIKLFGNVYLKPNLLFVQNDENVAIIYTKDNEYTFISKIDFTLGDEIFISLGEETFFLQRNTELSEYNYKNLLNIFKVQTVELYGYQIANPSLSISYLETGNLLVKAIKNQKNYLITFLAGKPKHETFYYSLEVQDPIDQILISNAGSNFNYQHTFLISETKSTLYYLNLNAFMLIEPDYQKQIFVQDLQLDVKISNQDTQQSVTYKQTVKETSSFVILQVQDKTYLNILEIEQNECPQEILIKNDWVTGQLTSVDFLLEKPDDDITFLPYLEFSENLLVDYHLIHAIQQDQNVFLQAKNNILYYTGEDVENAKPLLQNLSDQYFCYRIEKFENRLYSLCDNGVVSQIQITTCNDQLVCQRESSFINVPNAVQIIALEQDYIAILHGDEQAPELFDGSVVIYKLSKVDSIWQKTALLTIDYQFVKDKMGAKALNQFRPSSLQVSLTEQSYYQLIIVDSVNGLLYLDFNLVSATSTVNFLYLEYTLLKQWLNQNNQYASTNTVFFDAKIINSAIANKKKTLNVIVVTDISSSYFLQIEFAIQTDKTNKFTTMNTISAFNKPYENRSFKLSVSEKYVAIAEFGNSDFDYAVVNFYRLPNTNDGYKVLTRIGSNPIINFDNHHGFIMFAQNNFVLTSFDNHGIIINNLRSQLSLRFGDPEKLHDQTLYIIFYNDNFPRVERKIKLIVNTPVDNECIPHIKNYIIEPSSGETILWTLTQSLFEGFALKYSVEEGQTDFSIIQPTTQIGNSVTHISAAHQIVSAKAFLTQNQLWTHEFAFLDKNNTKYQIFYTKDAQISTAPSFSEVYTIKKEDNNLNCLDFVQLTTSIFVVDCQIDNNKFLILINQDQETYTTNIENTQTQRRLGSYSANSNKDLFVVRVTLSVTDDGDLANNSFVELFQLQSGQLVLKGTLDKATLQTISGKTIDQLNIIDFKIGIDRQIYLLDANLGTYFIVYFDTEWKLKNQINFEIPQAYAFDVELQSDYQDITILAYNYYAQFQSYQKVIQQIQDLSTFYSTYPQRIFASQGFVYLYDQTKLSIYHTASKESGLVDLVNLPDGAFIVNPLTSEIVTITLNEASRWYISLGALKFTGTAKAFDTPKTLEVTAISAHHITCSGTLQYSVLASNSQALIKQTKTDQPFPEIVNEDAESIELGSFVSAPNLQYELPNAANKRIQHSQRLEVKGIPAKIIYSSGVIVSEQDFFIQIFQTEDKKLNAYQCQHEKYQPTSVECQYKDSVQVDEQQNDDVFRIWASDYGRVPQFYALRTNYSFALYEYSIKDSKINYINSTGIVPYIGNEIISVLNSQVFVAFLVKSGLIIVTGQTSSSITKQELNGFTGEWNPKKLFGNALIHPNLLFVQNEDNIVIIQFERKEANFMAQIDFPKNNEISLSLGKETFFLLSNQELLEYNYKNLKNIYKIQTVELYGYQIINPQAAISYQHNGNFLIKATKNQQNYLISFKPNTAKHRTFYFSMQVQEFTTDTTFLLSSGGSGSSYQYTFLITETKSIFYLLAQYPELFVEPNQKEQAFVQKLELGVKISNQDTKQSVTYQQTVKEISNLQYLIVNDDTYLNTLEIKQDDCPQEFLIKNDWVKGQMSQVKLQLEKPDDEITLLPFLTNSQTILQDYYFTHAIQSDTNTFLQTNNNILFYNGEDVQNAKPLLQSLSDSFYCYKIEKIQNRLYSLCNNGVISQIQITTCNDQLACQRETTYIDVPNAVQIIALESDYIAVLHGDEAAPELSEGSVVIYKISKIDSIWQKTALLTIDYEFVKDKMGAKAFEDFRPSSLQVSLTEQSYYQLIIVDCFNGILFLDFKLDSTASTANFLYLEYIQLKQWLNQNNQYAYENTIFYDAKIINQVILNKKKTLDVIVVTDISSSYLLKIEFTIQTNKSNKLTTTNTSLAFGKSSNRASSFKVSASTNFVAIAEFIKTNQVSVNFYSLPQNIDDYQVLTRLGSYLTISDILDGFLLLAQNDYVLTSKNKSGLVVNNLRSQLALKFGDPEKLHDQKLTLTFQNSYSSVQREIKLTIKQSDVDVECKTKLENLKLYPSTGESLVWSLTQKIFEGVSLKYTINQATDFTVTQSLTQVGNSVTHVQAANLIISAKALMTPNQIWANQFAFLNKNANKYHIFYTKTASLNAAPSFTELYTVKKTDDNLICYDLAELSTTIFTIDCQINNNKFLVLVKDNEETYTTNIQNTQTQRRLGSYQVNGNQFVIRVTLSITNDGDLANNSFVELFQLTNNQLVSKETLDKTKLSTIYGKAIDQLNIVDFKIGANGAIYLLDAKIGIFIVSYDTDWKLQRLITYRLGQTFAFDRAVLQQNNQEVFTIKCYNYFAVINSQGKILKIQDFSVSIITYPQYLKQSQKYIFHSYQSKLYIYHSDESNSSLIDSINLTNAAAIINPVNQDLVLVSLTNSQRWSFSLGLLQFNQQAQPSLQFKELIITAKSQHGQVCTSKNYYQIIAQASQTVIKTVDTDEPLPSVLDENNEQIKLGSLVSGPNLVYNVNLANSDKFLDELLLDNDVDVQIVQNKQIQVSDWPMKTRYQTSLVGDNQETLYQVFQKEDNKITISKCELVDHVKYSCTDFSSEQVHTELSDQLFSIWQQDTIVKFITVDTSYIIKAFSVKDGKTDLDYTIKIDEEDETKQILSFLNQGDNVFVLHKNGELSSYNGDKLISSIIKLDGFDGEWKPLKLYGNRILKPNLLIVENENNIVLINYFHDEYVYVSTIAKAAQSQVFVTLSTTTFFVVINQTLEEYNYEYLNNIYKQKTVELFGYKIINPLAATTQLATGNLVVKTLKGEDTYVSIFKPGQTQHNTFYLAFKVEGVAAENDLTLTSGGSAYIVTLLNSEKFQQFNFILLEPQLIVLPNKKKHIYISEPVIQIKITNADSANNEIVFKQTVKVVNTFTNIIVDETKALKAIEIKPKTNSTNVLIDNAWITGQLPFSYLQAANLAQMSFSRYLNPTKTEVFKDRQFRAAVAFQKQLALQTTTNILYVKDGDLTNAKALFKDDLESQYNCFAIDASGSTLYSLCNNGVENQIQVVTCEDINNCKRQDAYISAPQAIQIATIQQGLLVLLHTDSSNPEDVDGKLTIQKLAAVDDIWSSTLLFTLDYQFIKNKMGAQAVAAFRPSSFQVSNTGEDNDSTFVQLIITDSVNGILSFDISISKATQEIKYIYLEYILLTKWLNENKQYASDSTHYYSGQIVEQTIREQKKTVSFAIVTDNASSFILNLEFAIQENKSNKLTQTKVTETLNRYGSIRAINKIAANANTVIIPYQNHDDVIVGVYQIVKDAPAQVIHGSYSFLVESTFEPIDFLLHLQDKKLIASSTKKGVYEYEIREQMQISFGNSTLISNQTLTLLVSNHYKYTKQDIALSVWPDSDDTNKKSSNAWWWVLGFALGIMSIGLAGFIFYKKKGSGQDGGYEPIIN